jgi:thiosulfate/3-mercaptopyruvate sulfurtransferase
VLALPGPVVSADWLADHLDDPTLVIADVRWYVDGRSGEAAYDAGHLPGAIWVDLDRDLAGPSGLGPGRHPLPSPEHFAAAMNRLAIGDGDVVVAYDDAGGSIAARFWWMLTAIGHSAAVLDGGISAWTGELSNDLPSERPDSQFSVRPWPLGAAVDAVAVDTLRRDDDAIVLDARSSERFRGEPNPIDRRPGHIPGAVSAPWVENLDPETGRFRSVNALRERFTGLGVRADRPAVCHCGSGVTACHNLLALTLAKLPSGRLYPGSWSDWSADPGRPVAVDDSRDPATLTGAGHVRSLPVR